MSDEFFNSSTGPLDPLWLNDGTSDSSVRYIDVSTTKLYNDPLYGKPRGVRIDRGLSSTRIRVPLFSSATGAPLVAAVGSYSVAPVVQAAYSEASGYCPGLVTAYGSLSTDGRLVAISLPTEVSDNPGIYTAQFRILDGAGVERERNEFWVYVDRGLWRSDGSASADGSGPPTTKEIRNALRDHPGANRLLGEYEFDVAEMAMAVASAIGSYMTEFPPVPSKLNSRSWPSTWRRPLLDGILAYLFETAAHYHRRGMLPYSAGGVSIDDLNKAGEYEKASQMYRDRFSRWSKLVKARSSIQAGFGSSGSGYPGQATY